MCRSFLSTWKNDNDEEVYDGRCNMGVVSVNLPRIALEVKDIKDREERIKAFFDLLQQRCDLSHKALQTRIKRLETVQAKVAPICWMYGALGRLKPDDHIINHLKNGYASISLGYVGLSECINALYDNEVKPNSNVDCKETALKIIKTLDDNCKKWKKEEGFGYSVYGTPAENLAGRFERLDKEKFGTIQGVTDKEYYTNSFHLDVQEKVSPFDKILYEKDYLPYTSGGMITYVELPNMSNNLQGLEEIINFAYSKVGYFGINSPIDVCSCGWSGEAEFTENGFKCPKCDTVDPSKIHCIRRVCG